MHGSDRPRSLQLLIFGGSPLEICQQRSFHRNCGALRSCHSPVRLFLLPPFYIADPFPNADITTRQFHHSADVMYTNETLLQHGFLGATPEKPTLAFSLDLLEIYRQLRRVCPRFSLDALAKALCHLHRACTSFTLPVIIPKISLL